MTRRGTLHIAALLAIGLGALAPATAQQAAPQAQQTYQDIEKSAGLVPEFMRQFPQVGIAGAWTEMRDIQFNPNTALPNKVKELIGLAVAAQVPCEYCIYAHTQAAKANGASDAEIREAVAMAAITRHWSTVLNGLQMDKDRFRREFDQILSYAGEQAKARQVSK
jgi:AhpD family alkylhydroperoxidase